MMNEQPGRPKSTEVYHRLRRIAREQGRQTDELFQMYLLERFLFRWATSKYAGQFVLKGGTLLAAYDLRRATRDIDVQILEEPYDLATIMGVAQASCVPDLATRRQVPWLRWRNRMGLDNALPEQFQEAIEQVVAFADPIIDGSIGNKTWNPQSQAWR